MSERLAIIRDVRVGASDYGQPGISFTTYITESSAASQFLDWEEAGKVMAKISDVKELNGWPCWVEVDGNLIKFLRIWDKR
jgi:hypothetical protein